MDSVQNLVQFRVNQFRGAAVPPAAMMGFANAQVMKAFNTYNPSKGASLQTHINWHLKKVQTFVVENQNLGKIPDQRVNNITEFKTAKSDLKEELGHEPDSLTLAEHLGWSQKEVARMESEQRKDLIESLSPEVDSLKELYSAREREVLRYIHYDLTPDERLVFEYSLGLYGKPQLSATDIAKQLNISKPRVSRIRKKIDQKLRARGV
jgi:RNA polymerase sigma factor (sigma-70 family)